MALRIVQTIQADKGLEKVLEYLEEEWSVKEILNLEQNLQDLLTRIAKYPKICPVTGEYKNVHKALVDKNNYIVYRKFILQGSMQLKCHLSASRVQG